MTLDGPYTVAITCGIHCIERVVARKHGPNTEPTYAIGAAGLAPGPPTSMRKSHLEPGVRGLEASLSLKSRLKHRPAFVNYEPAGGRM